MIEAFFDDHAIINAGKDYALANFILPLIYAIVGGGLGSAIFLLLHRLFITQSSFLPNTLAMYVSILALILVSNHRAFPAWFLYAIPVSMVLGYAYTAIDLRMRKEGAE